MPNYDFICTKCSHKFTVQVPMAEKDKVSCPQCGGKVRQSFLGHLAGFISGKLGGSNRTKCGGG